MSEASYIIFQDLIEVVDDVKPIKNVKKLNDGKKYRILPPFNRKFKIHSDKGFKVILKTKEDSLEYHLMVENTQMNKAISIFNLNDSI